MPITAPKFVSYIASRLRVLKPTDEPMKFRRNWRVEVYGIWEKGFPI